MEPAPTHATVITETEEILPENPEADQEYEVEKILDSGYVDGQFRYLIKWAGYDDSENTWEPPENCEGCKDLVKEFHLWNPDRPKPEDPPPRRKRGRPRKNPRKGGRINPQTN